MYSPLIGSHLRRSLINKECLWDLIALLVLGALGLAQPILDILAKNPEFFLASGADGGDVVNLTVYLCLLVTVQFFFPLEIIAALFGRLVRRIVHFLLVAFFAGVIVLPALKTLPLSHWAIIGWAAVSGLVFAISYFRFDPVRLFIRFLTPVLVIFPLLFLSTPAISAILWPQGIDIDQPGNAVDNPISIVFILFDEFNTTGLLNADLEIDAESFPNFAALANDANWYRNASTVSSGTTYAIPAILSGEYVTRYHVLPTSQNYPDNLFHLLAGTHKMRVVEGLTRLCPREYCPRVKLISSHELLRRMAGDASIILQHRVLPEELTTALPDIDNSWANFKEAADDPATRNWDEKHLLKEAFGLDKKQAFAQFVSGIERTEIPTLHFLHFLFPHRGYTYIPSGKQYRTEQLNPAINDRWNLDEQAIDLELQRYMLQLGYADKMVGQLVARLKAQGLYDQSLLIITSDHGLGFEMGKHNRVLTGTNYVDLMAVPLFIKVPGYIGGTNPDWPVESVDILPTIADALQIDLTFEPDGFSLLNTQYPDKKTRIVHDHAKGFREYEAQEAPVQKFPVQIPFEEGLLSRKKRLFGNGTGAEKHFRSGPFRDLIGTAVDEYNPVHSKNLELAVTHLHELTRFEPNDSVTPGMVFATLQAGVNDASRRGPIDIALAANGIIQSTSRALIPLEDGAVHFSLFLPERALESGKNAIDFYLVSRTALNEVQLTPIHDVR